MSDFSALGKLMKGSGLEEIGIEAGLCASGSLNGGLKGRHHNRAMRIHAWMVETLERLLFISFVQTLWSNQMITEITSGVKNLERKVCHAAFDNVWNLLFAQYVYEFFKEQVKCGNMEVQQSFGLTIWKKYGMFCSFQ